MSGVGISSVCNLIGPTDFPVAVESVHPSVAGDVDLIGTPR
jgi:hypothetical protein